MAINREIRFGVTGENDSRVQAFYNNYYANLTPVQTNYFIFNKPSFVNYGGTSSYYSQDPFSIFTNLVRPPIRFLFSANTGSLSGDSYFIHKIYRLDYNIYKLYSDNQITEPLEYSNKIDSNNANDISNSINPQIAGTSKITGRGFTTKNEIPSGNNPIPLPEKLYGQNPTARDLSTLQKYLSEPLITFTAATSGITTLVYDLYLDQYIKKFGNYKTELFIDKAQYFVDTTMVFNVNLNRPYNSYTPSYSTSATTSGMTGTNTSTFFASNLNISNQTITTPWENKYEINVRTSSGHTITSGPWSGLSVTGNFFTYFTVPDKPLFEYPILSGTLSTFTPEFRWSNGENADSFIFQINYNTGDTTFTGTVFNYPVEKKAENTKVSESIEHGVDSQYATSKNLYTFQVPVKSNKSFLFRVGNSKEIVDIFDVRRNVVTFSDYYSAISQPEPIRTYVFVEADSKYVEAVSGFLTPPSLLAESAIEEYSLSGTVTGGTITGATMQLLYPNGNFVTTVTSTGGTYSFTGLEPGTYTLTTMYRGFETDIRYVVVTNANIVLNFRLHLLWGNGWDTWGSLADQNYFI